jgi:serine/threonine protein kinase
VPPRTIGPYEILSVAGRGGIGTVYRARDRRTGTLAALKLLAPPPAADPTAARRLAREFEALRGLDHPNVVRVLEAGVSEGYSFLAMELVDGLDLRSYLSPAFDLDPAARPGAREGDPVSTCSGEPDTEGILPALERGSDAIRAFADRIDEPDTAEVEGPPAMPPELPGPPAPPRPAPPSPPRELLDLLNAPPRLERMRDALGQVCSGLAHVHAGGLVHRDLKPSNIMVDERRRVRIMDFGLVKHTHEGGLALYGRIVGTYRYMAPEQARGLYVDARADLYSLGVILFELLCGRPPFVAGGAAELWEEITARPPPAVASINPRADGRLARVAERLLQKDPAERFRSAADVAAAIR